jgi:hypothetical protein
MNAYLIETKYSHIEKFLIIANSYGEAEQTLLECTDFDNHAILGIEMISQNVFIQGEGLK